MKTQVLILGLLTVGVVLAIAVLVPAEEPASDPSSEDVAKPTPIVIDAKTLEKYSEQGNVTEVSKARQKGTASLIDAVQGGGDLSGTGPTLSGEAALEEEERRQYWRSQYQRQLELVESLENQIEVLDEEIPGLWRDFYAWDDPMYRDGVIKPKLDAALTRRQSIEEKLGEERGRLPQIKEKARRDGATPGWFRGVDKAKSGDDEDAPQDESVLPTDFKVGVVSADDT
jgi:hypothetical protein